MKKAFLGLALVLVLAGAFLLAAVDVTGDWDMTVKRPQGDRTSVVNFTQTGENLAVKTTGMNGQEVTGTGTIKGNDIEWTIVRTTQQGEFKMVYKGKVEGDKMSGTFDMRGTPVAWTAVKKAK